MITYRTTVDELSNELGRPPVPAEVFSSMNLDHRQGTRLLQDVENAQVVRLQRWKPDDEGGSFDQLVIDNAHQRDGDPEPHILASEELAQLREAISHLNDRQRTVVTLRYISGMTQQQVAEIIGVTNARICQIEGVALQRLREIFAESDLAETRVAVS